MIKYKYVIGVDISKAFFDAVTSDGHYSQFENSKSGFESFLKEIPKKSIVVMESTGYYHHQLAQFLVSKKVKTSVVNPLSVKRFRQMKLLKVKTDKADAAIICAYALQNDVPLYTKKSVKQMECNQLQSLAELYGKQRVSLKNKLQGEYDMGSPSLSTIRSIKRQLRTLLQEIIAIEKELNDYIKKLHPGQVKLLMAIPGIGIKTSNQLVLVTEGFQKFDHSKKLCSYVGITPTIRQSGSTIRGKSYISKTGSAKIRNLLFMCSFSASKYNAACRSLFERIVAKGKSKKLALIAVCNKLLKQAFAIVKTNKPYSNDYYQPAFKPEMPAHCFELG